MTFVRVIQVGVIGVLVAGCAVERKPIRVVKPPVQQAPHEASKPVEPKTQAVVPGVSLDTLLTALAPEAQAVKDASTTIVRDEAFKNLEAKANKLMDGRALYIEVTVTDVRMKNDQMATLSISGLKTPMLDRANTVIMVNVHPRIDLPMSKELAMSIKPGQRIQVKGKGAFKVGTGISVVMLQNIIARVSYKGVPTIKQSLLLLQPTEYSFLPDAKK